ncbi:hypothetical protein F5Y07DRAFT_96079 [Xylaria sp. FL0933]|nr:hypothetical protein F5Y07DRAFT_96079 [Xylaria sp. FL0933]
MADPVTTIIGLVSGIITFIDFGHKFVSEVRNIHNSVHGTTANIHELDLVISDVRHSNELAMKLPRNQLSHDELRIIAMVVECEKLVRELQKATSLLRRRDDARQKKLESARVAVRSFLKQDEIQALRSRLDALDLRIRGHLSSILQNHQNSLIMAKLAQIESSHRRMEIQNESKLHSIRSDLLSLSEDQTRLNNPVQAAARGNRLIDIKAKLDLLQGEQSSCTLQIKVLESLYFPELSRRWHQIKNADIQSNAWIFDPEKTSFVSWLEGRRQGDGFFYITGRAGSGKSTLMKFVAQSEHTVQSLEKWADKAKLYTASYYFWNQGTEKQKTGVGLFQSLLYQILRSAPELITYVYRTRLHHEVWEMEDLIGIFKRIAQQTSLDTKFCFFVDGLDEYDGEEKDIIRLLQELSSSKHIKICASSRPGRQYESILPRDGHTFDIARFTKGDMERYIDTRLQSCTNWRHLAATDPVCQDILNELSARAGGVWLWVSLVTADIIKEAEKNEEVATLRRIVDEFPADLHKYFERMIKRIPRFHQEEMAQIFLIAVEGLQPLPLYAFALLAQERKSTNYAIYTPITPISKTDIKPRYPALKDRIRNRCSDLLIVDDGPHPAFLSHSVDFLHRTVRDFLQGEYDKQLRAYVKKEFDPLVSLSRICLGLLKALPVFEFWDRDTANKVMNLTDEILYYAQEIEKRKYLHDTPLVSILDELDRVNSHHARDLGYHWTHARDPPAKRGYDEYFEGGECNFLALAVQAHLVQYVRVKVQADPRNMQKRGRPLLDYALRPRRATPISMPYHSIRDDPSVDVDMVELLLERGANPNQPVHLNNGTSVWGLFLLSVYESHELHSTSLGFAYQSLNKAWYQACFALIRAGARRDCLSRYADDGLDLSVILEKVFGRDRAAALEQAME